MQSFQLWACMHSHIVACVREVDLGKAARRREHIQECDRNDIDRAILAVVREALLPISGVSTVGCSI